MNPHRRTSSASVFAVTMVAAAVAMLGLNVNTAPAQAETPASSSVIPAAATPTPTLGSTNGSDANPPGSADGDPSDWSGMKWLPLGLLIPVIFVAGVFVAKRRDRNRDDSSTAPPSPRVD